MKHRHPKRAIGIEQALFILRMVWRAGRNGVDTADLRAAFTREFGAHTTRTFYRVLVTLDELGEVHYERGAFGVDGVVESARGP